MNNDIYMRGLLLSIVYAIFKYIETVYINKDELKLKHLLKNSLIVYISFIASCYIYQQIEPYKVSNFTKVFTEAPNF